MADTTGSVGPDPASATGKTADTEGVSTAMSVAKRTSVKKTATAAAEQLRVRPGEEPWTDEELLEVRGELESDVTRLRSEIAAAETELADLLRDPGDGAGDDQADAGTKAFEREHEMSLANNARDLLLQAERALKRIDDGTYGVCEMCGSPIGKARLQAFPRATLCVTCKQREERR
jgi:RNA polymerase-binding protein DksA